MDYAVQNAYHMVKVSEEEYLQKNGKYTTDYGELESEAYLRRDPNVEYGPIKLVESKTTGMPGYRFAVRHKKDPSIAYEVDTTSRESVRKLSR
jgi:hypothetical protein